MEVRFINSSLTSKEGVISSVKNTHYCALDTLLLQCQLLEHDLSGLLYACKQHKCNHEEGHTVSYLNIFQ
jgi:hypothetical protein